METDFHRRLEPAAGRVIHGAGQSEQAFRDYWEHVQPACPMNYMAYRGLRGKGHRAWGRKLREALDAYAPACLIPQIGLAMTHDGRPEQHYEQDVAAGQHEDRIEAFCEALIGLDRPVFLRIGYEFNGPWNGYDAASYVDAWRRVEAALRQHRLEQVATVWCYAPDGEDKSFLKYYPGDDVVDWWSLDTFSVEHFTQADTCAFMEAAANRRFPVMIGESTPRRVGVQDGLASWSGWFAHYVAFIRRYPHLKAFSYISWDWLQIGNPAWLDWGNGRIGYNEEVLAAYRAELADAMYVHAASREETLRLLRVN